MFSTTMFPQNFKAKKQTKTTRKQSSGQTFLLQVFHHKIFLNTGHPLVGYYGLVDRRKKKVSIDMNSELKKEQGMLGFSSPLNTIGVALCMWQVGNSQYLSCLSISHLRVEWALQGAGGPKVAGSFQFLLQLSIRPNNHFVINYGVLALQGQLKEMSPTSVFTFSVTAPTRCFPFTRKFWALP